MRWRSSGRGTRRCPKAGPADRTQARRDETGAQTITDARERAGEGCTVGHLPIGTEQPEIRGEEHEVRGRQLGDSLGVPDGDVERVIVGDRDVEAVHEHRAPCIEPDRARQQMPMTRERVHGVDATGETGHRGARIGAGVAPPTSSP